MAGVGAGVVLPVGAARADDVTVSHDVLRTGWDAAEPGLSPAALGSSDFGRLFSTPVDGQVYAQPVVAGPTVVAVTENDNVYGLDKVTGAVRWTRSVGPAWPAAAIGCGDLAPTIGSTATPVYDPATGTVYLTAKVDDGPDDQHPHWYMHALDAATGAERTGWPVTIQGVPSNDPGHPFDAFTAAQRPGLLLLGGTVYAAFASHCDYGAYVGYVAGVSTTTHAIRGFWSAESGPSSAEAGIWQSGGGLVSDGPARILLTTGNGVSPPAGPGSSPPSVLAESVVRLSVAGDGTLSAQDFFAPSNAPQLDAADTDLGSGGPMALPPPFGTASHPHLLVQVGKDGRVFLLDRDHLGGRSQGSGGTDAVVGTSGPFHGVWGHPGFYGGQGGYAYTVENGGYLRALAYGVSGSGVPVLSSAGTSTGTFGYTSGSPVVTSDATTAGSALVWVVYAPGPTGAGSELRAYDAVPQNGVLALRWSAPIGTAAKFTTVATDAGRVYVGTRDGHVLGFGRPATSPLSTQPVDLGPVAVGATATATVAVTATRTVTVTAATAGAPFAVAPPALPVTLAAGQQLRLTVGVTPSAPGPVTGALTLGTDQGAVGLDLSATGTRAGLAGPASLDFGTVPTGTPETLTADLANTGTSALTVTGAGLPAAPFTVADPPPTGTVVQPGASVAVPVTFAPTAAGPAQGSLTVTSTAGSTTVGLTGTGETGSPHLVLAPAALDFGAVPLGRSALRSFTLTNTGNLTLTLTKAAPPAAPFLVTNPVAEGLQLAPGQSVRQDIVFTPTAGGTAAGGYVVTSNDGRGAQAVTLTGTGLVTLPPGPVPAPAAGGWTLNGSAALSGTDLVLTPARPGLAGSAVLPTPVGTANLHAAFTAQIGGGTGADGLTFALLDPAGATATSLGSAGSGLGLGRLPGVAVALDTYRNGIATSANFVGISTGPADATGSHLHDVATANVATSLRSGTHVVVVDVSYGHLLVAVDRRRLLDVAVAVPPRALLAFTGGTGGLTDSHVVRGVAVTAGSVPVTLPPVSDPSWTLGGTAARSGGDLVLTPASVHSAGSAFSSSYLLTAGLTATFTAQLGPGTGADGLTFALLDAARSGPRALGNPGGALGFAGLPGVAVTLDTYRNGGDPSANFVGVTAGGWDATNASVRYLATAPLATPLRGTPHVVTVAVAPGNHLLVSIDGRQVLDAVAPVPLRAYAGFTAGTGGLADAHTVRAVTIMHP